MIDRIMNILEAVGELCDETKNAWTNTPGMSESEADRKIRLKRAADARFACAKKGIPHC